MSLATTILPASLSRGPGSVGGPIDGLCLDRSGSVEGRHHQTVLDCVRMHNSRRPGL